MISSQNPKNWLRKFGVPHQTSFQAKQLQAVQVALLPNPLFHWHTRFGKVQPRHLNDQELFEEQKRICDLPRPALTDRQMILLDTIKLRQPLLKLIFFRTEGGDLEKNGKQMKERSRMRKDFKGLTVSALAMNAASPGCSRILRRSSCTR